MSYRDAILWHETHCTAGYVAPCRAPGGGKDPCENCVFFGRKVETVIDPIASLLAGRVETVSEWVNPGLCARLLAMAHHAYHVGGAGGCRKCGAARSHPVHWPAWEYTRGLWGFIDAK